MKEETIDEAGHFFRPKYKIFFSVDIVGSTKLKAKDFIRSSSRSRSKSKYERQEWLPHWIEFYSNFPAFFFEEWRQLADNILPKHPQYVGEAPEIWKSIGDELIFVKRVVDRYEIRVAVCAWRNALLRYKNESKSGLTIKSSIFGAGFPVTNSELFVERLPTRSSSRNVLSYKRHNKERVENYYAKRADPGLSVLEQRVDEIGYSLEYLGPDIDAGFRLARSASPERIVIGCDIAWFLFDHLMGVQDRERYMLNLPDVRFSGFTNLDGVYFDIEYPILSIDIQDGGEHVYSGSVGDEQFDDAVRKISEGYRNSGNPINIENITSFLNAFYAHHEAVLNRPFIWEEKNKEGRGNRAIRDDFRSKLCEMIGEYNLEVEVLEDDQLEQELLDSLDYADEGVEPDTVNSASTDPRFQVAFDFLEKKAPKP